MPRFIRRYWFPLILVLLFLFLRLPSLFEPYWYGDEGIYLALGLAIRRGWTLYSQIHDNKPPGLYYLAAFSRTVFGFRLLLFFWMIPTVIVFYRLASQFLKKTPLRLALFLFILLTSIPVIEGNIANAEVFMLLPTLAAIYLLYSQPITGYRLLITGFLLGLAFTIKVPVAIEFTFLFFWLILLDFQPSLSKFFLRLKSHLSRYLLFIFGFSLPIFLWGVYFYFHQALVPFLFAALLQNFSYLSSWATGNQASSALSGGLSTRLLVLILFWGIAATLFLKKKLGRPYAFLLFWFAATIFGALLSGRPYPHYLIQVVPPLIIILASLVFTNRHSDRILLVGTVATFALIIHHFRFYTYATFPYYRNFYGYALGSKSLTDYHQTFGSHVTEAYQLASYIQDHSSPDDKIFIWGDSPYVYPLANRLPVGRFTTAYHILDFNGYSDTITQLEINLPPLIIYYPMANRPFPKLDDFIFRFYSLQNRIGEALIYQLR